MVAPTASSASKTTRLVDVWFTHAHSLRALLRLSYNAKSSHKMGATCQSLHKAVLCMQLSARTYTAGPANHTAYVEGVGFMYKEHRVLVELDAVYNKTKEEDFLKSGILGACLQQHIPSSNHVSHGYLTHLHAVFVNDTRLVAPVRDDNFVMRLEYPCYDGTTMQLIWQAFRPILGNTVELTTGAERTLGSGLV